MRNLISAGFLRLVRDKFFYIGIAVTIVFSTVIGFIVNRSATADSVEEILFMYTMIVGVLVAVFCSLFLGMEYSDGAIRNKLTVGQSRTCVYFSNLLTCLTFGVIICVVAILSSMAVGIPLLGPFKSPPKTILLYIFASIILVLAFTSISVFISMLIQNKAVASIVNVLGAFALLFAAIWLISRLEEPEVYNNYIFMNSLGEIVTDAGSPNPNYVGGTKRVVFEFLMEFLPYGQAFKMQNMTADPLWHLPVYSAIIAFVMNLLGVSFFRKKDLK